MQNNFLPSNEFRLVIDRLPNTTFMCQRANIPELTLSPPEQKTPFSTINRSSDNVEFGVFNIEFKVSEKLENYLEMYNWIIGTTFPVEYPQRRALEESQFGLFSDATLLIPNSARGSSVEVKFQRLQPLSLGSLEFDSTLTDVEFFTCQASFKYLNYTITVL